MRSIDGEVVTQQAGLAGLVNGPLDALNGQRVFRPTVDVAHFGPDGSGPYDHALDDGMGV